jgi:hypothetical protein
VRRSHKVARAAEQGHATVAAQGWPRGVRLNTKRSAGDVRGLGIPRENPLNQSMNATRDHDRLLAVDQTTAPAEPIPTKDLYERFAKLRESTRYAGFFLSLQQGYCSVGAEAPPGISKSRSSCSHNRTANRCRFLAATRLFSGRSFCSSFMCASLCSTATHNARELSLRRVYRSPL